MRFFLNARRFVERRAELLAFGALSLFVYVFHFGFHEPWRDESQAWLIARAESSRTLMEELRFEGHPPLPYFLLDFVTRLAAPIPLALLAALNTAVLLSGTCAFLRAMGTTRRAAILFTVAVSCTYFYAYELGVVARAYGIGIGLAFFMTARLQRALETGEKRELVHAGLLGAAAALTSATAAVHVLAAVVVFSAVWSLSRPTLALGRLAPIAIAMFVVRDVTQHNPARYVQFESPPQPDRTMEFDWTETRRWLGELFGFRSADTWWSTADLHLSVAEFDRAVEWLRILVVVCVALNGLRFIREWRTALFIPLAGALEVAGIFYVVFYRGLVPDYRHWTFVMTTTTVVLGGLCLTTTRRGVGIVMLRRAALVLLAPWLWNQARVAYSNFEQDFSYPFSETKHFARSLPHGARIIAMREMMGTSISYWRPDVVVRSPNHGGRYFTYVRWDISTSSVPLHELVREECGMSPTGTVYFFGAPNGAPPQCVEPMYTPYDGPKARTDEYDQGFVAHCACSIRPRP